MPEAGTVPVPAGAMDTITGQLMLPYRSCIQVTVCWADAVEARVATAASAARNFLSMMFSFGWGSAGAENKKRRSLNWRLARAKSSGKPHKGFAYPVRISG
jgi:hypothetical protein